MPIEKEIPKSYFRNSSHKTLVNIFYTSNWILEKLKQFLESEDITHQQYNILRILSHSEKPLSTLQIREQMLDKMSDTSRIVERLLKKSLVNKQVSRIDKRLVDVTISEKGAQLLRRLDKKTHEMDSVVSSLNSEELETVNQLLDKIREGV
jgi:DNA-binding MarR family transcriptional regulator